MQRVAESVFWCPRCGTLHPNHEHAEVPKLVERCREFEERRHLVAAGDFRPWFTLGVAESIRPPAERLTPETF